MLTLLKILQWLMLSIVILAATATFGTWLVSWHPTHGMALPITGDDAPLLSKTRTLKVMSWNIQYMAGKNYVFFYDLLDGSGPHMRPSSGDITATFDLVAAKIKEVNPDVIFLQEIDDGAKRTDNEDQLARLLTLLPRTYSTHVSTFYWKAGFVPHPKIMGRVGMKLAIISRFRLESAVHHSLPLMPGGWILQQFNIKRAVLEARLPLREGGAITLLNTHLDAFAQGTDTMERQVAYLKSLLDEKTRAREAWILGGDFNLLMPGASYERLGEKQRAYFKPVSELRVLSDHYPSFPSPQEVNGPKYREFLSHYPNDPQVKGPDRTIDFLFYSPLLHRDSAHVDQRDRRISDHFPLTVTFNQTP